MKAGYTILHLDDDPFFLEGFARSVQGGHEGVRLEVEGFSDSGDFLNRLRQAQAADLVVLDVYLGEGKGTGDHLAKEIRRQLPGVVLLMCSDLRDSATVKRCLTLGADDYLFKGLDEEEFPLRILQALEKAAPPPAGTGAGQEDWAGSLMQGIAGRIGGLIGSAVTSIHVTGESGTGKEVVAGLFEKQIGGRMPFSKVHCGAIAPGLLESELFGHVRGAFTGAVRDKAGILEKADGGWVFLDEVATLSPRAQVVLLRVLENGSIRRVGDTVERAIRVRLISATNESIPELVRQGRFRADLWQRICEATIELPPLRERMDELPGLVDFFCAAMEGGPWKISRGALNLLEQYDWREGNIRELRNCLRAMTERAVNKTLTPAAIPGHIWERLSTRPAMGAEDPAPAGNRLVLSWQGKDLPDFESLSDQLLLEMLRMTVEKQGRTGLREFARLSGVPRTSLSRRLREMVERQKVSGAEMARLINIRTKGQELR